MNTEFDYPRDFKGIFIPKEIWLDDKLSAIDKFILAEIDSLDTEDGDGCYASNEYLSKFCKCSITKVSTSISKLIDLGYVKIAKSDGRKRFLKVSLSKFERQSYKKRKSANQKMKESNISSKTKDKNIDEYNKYAFKEDKSSSKDNIYASVPKEQEVHAKANRGRYIPNDYSYEQFREHIRPVYSSVLKNNYGYSDLDSPIEKILDITINFYRMYEKEIGTKHRVLSDKAYENVVDYFMNPPDILDDYMFDTDCYMAMAEQYFQTEYNRHGNYNGTIEKSFSHFMSCSVREHLFYQTCY